MLLKKIRDSYDLLKNLQKKQYRDFLQFNKKRVIDLQSHGERVMPAATTDP